jgi:hypothetical protein
LANDESGHTEHHIAKSLAQTSRQMGAAADGEGAIAAPVYLLVAQTAAAQGVAVRRTQGQTCQQSAVGLV